MSRVGIQQCNWEAILSHVPYAECTILSTSGYNMRLCRMIVHTLKTYTISWPTKWWQRLSIRAFKYKSVLFVYSYCHMITLEKNKIIIIIKYLALEEKKNSTEFATHMKNVLTGCWFCSLRSHTLSCPVEFTVATSNCFRNVTAFIVQLSALSTKTHTK